MNRCPANLALWQRLKLLTYFFFSKSFVITIKECCQSCGSLLHWGAEFGPKNLQNSPFWPKMYVPLDAHQRILMVKFPLYHDWTCCIWWWTRWGLKKTITLNKQKKFLGHPKWPWSVKWPRWGMLRDIANHYRSGCRGAQAGTTSFDTWMMNTDHWRTPISHRSRVQALLPKRNFCWYPVYTSSSCLVRIRLYIGSKMIWSTTPNLVLLFWLVWAAIRLCFRWE